MSDANRSILISILSVGLVAIGCSSFPWSEPEPASPPRSAATAAGKAESSAQKTASAPPAASARIGGPPKVTENVPSKGAERPNNTESPVKVEVAGGSKSGQSSTEDDGSMVPDCHGGKIKAPLWLLRIPFWAALCVHGPAKKSIKVDIGTNLIAHPGLADASAVTEHQVYYSLRQIEVPAGQKQIVWAVCGGGGDWLWNGTRVVPGHRLPAGNSKRLAAQVNVLEGIASDIELFRGMLARTRSGDDARELEKRIKQLDDALTDAAGLLRDALIRENHVLLTKSGRPAGPLWH